MEGGARHYGFRKLVEKVTQASTLFSEVTLDFVEPKDADLTIKMAYRGSVRFNDVLSNPLGQIITLGYGPLNASQRSKITATVVDRNKTTIGNYVVEDAIETSLGPFATLRLSWERSTFEGVLENMVRNIYRKMLDDKILTNP